MAAAQPPPLASPYDGAPAEVRQNLRAIDLEMTQKANQVLAIQRQIKSGFHSVDTRDQNAERIENYRRNQDRDNKRDFLAVSSNIAQRPVQQPPPDMPLQDFLSLQRMERALARLSIRTPRLPWNIQNAGIAALYVNEFNRHPGMIDPARNVHVINDHTSPAEINDALLKLISPEESHGAISIVTTGEHVIREEGYSLFYGQEKQFMISPIEYELYPETADMDTATKENEPQQESMDHHSIADDFQKVIDRCHNIGRPAVISAVSVRYDSLFPSTPNSIATYICLANVSGRVVFISTYANSAWKVPLAYLLMDCSISKIFWDESSRQAVMHMLLLPPAMLMQTVILSPYWFTFAGPVVALHEPHFYGRVGTWLGHPQQHGNALFMVMNAVFGNFRRATMPNFGYSEEDPRIANQPPGFEKSKGIAIASAIAVIDLTVAGIAYDHRGHLEVNNMPQLAFINWIVPKLIQPTLSNAILDLMIQDGVQLTAHCNVCEDPTCVLAIIKEDEARYVEQPVSDAMGPLFVQFTRLFNHIANLGSQRIAILRANGLLDIPVPNMPAAYYEITANPLATLVPSPPVMPHVQPAPPTPRVQPAVPAHAPATPSAPSTSSSTGPTATVPKYPAAAAAASGNVEFDFIPNELPTFPPIHNPTAEALGNRVKNYMRHVFPAGYGLADVNPNALENYMEIRRILVGRLNLATGMVSAPFTITPEVIQRWERLPANLTAGTAHLEDICILIHLAPHQIDFIARTTNADYSTEASSMTARTVPVPTINFRQDVPIPDIQIVPNVSIWMVQHWRLQYCEVLAEYWRREPWNRCYAVLSALATEFLYAAAKTVGRLLDDNYQGVSVIALMRAFIDISAFVQRNTRLPTENEVAAVSTDSSLCLTEDELAMGVYPMTKEEFQDQLHRHLELIPSNTINSEDILICYPWNIANADGQPGIEYYSPISSYSRAAFAPDLLLLKLVDGFYTERANSQVFSGPLMYDMKDAAKTINIASNLVFRNRFIGLFHSPKVPYDGTYDPYEEMNKARYLIAPNDNPFKCNDEWEDHRQRKKGRFETPQPSTYELKHQPPPPPPPSGGAAGQGSSATRSRRDQTTTSQHQRSKSKQTPSRSASSHQRNRKQVESTDSSDSPDIVEYDSAEKKRQPKVTREEATFVYNSTNHPLPTTMAQFPYSVATPAMPGSNPAYYNIKVNVTDFLKGQPAAFLVNHPVTKHAVLIVDAPVSIKEDRYVVDTTPYPMDEPWEVLYAPTLTPYYAYKDFRQSDEIKKFLRRRADYVITKGTTATSTPSTRQGKGRGRGKPLDLTTPLGSLSKIPKLDSQVC